MSNEDGFGRRDFLAGLAASRPALELVGAAGSADGADQAAFHALDLAPQFNNSPTDFGPREPLRNDGKDGLFHRPSGSQSLRGIPFLLGPGGANDKSSVLLSTRTSSTAATQVEVAVGRKATHVCLAQFCDWDEMEQRAETIHDYEKLGQLLAEVVLQYEGGERVLPVRRRFEVNSPTFPWGHWSFTSVTHGQPVPIKITDGTGNMWGLTQSAIRDPAPPFLWVCALENPEPERELRSIRIRAKAVDPLVLCGLTLFTGAENPLRYGRLNVYRITLPETTTAEAWRVSVDLGSVARTYNLDEFDAASWMQAPDPGLGGRRASRVSKYLYAEVTSNPSAILRLAEVSGTRSYAFELGQALPGQALTARAGGPVIELLEPRRTWLHARILDGGTGRPTPARIAFRSKEGRYIPPYAHRTEINRGWFHDYGADLKLREVSYAYVDGTFQVELPVGEVYVELRKGFEYEAIKKKLTIAPGQRELDLEMPRHADLRAEGWVTADTHVHFLSPSTAVLEAQAEGLNLINLLGAQWGDLFTNIGDLAHGPLHSRDGETIVWPGTENRSHMLGHIGLLGGHGEPVYPLSGSYPTDGVEAYFGDPLSTTMADWADACRAREGLSVAVHFPYPTAEIAADIVLGKIDAVEVGAPGTKFNSLPFLDWYRCLNCGYRLPVVGGTDKMSAGVAVGAVRTYAHLGQDEFSFATWAKAVRRGNTFTTTGPLLSFQAEGRWPGSEIRMAAGGGTIEVSAQARSVTPVHRIEIVVNGEVVSSREEANGARLLTLKEKIRVPGTGWVAARCGSRFGVSAHTSAVYLATPGQELFSAPAAAYLMTLIEGTQAWIENLATRPDPEKLERMRAVLNEAHTRLHGRMQAHGHRH